MAMTVEALGQLAAERGYWMLFETPRRPDIWYNVWLRKFGEEGPHHGKLRQGVTAAETVHKAAEWLEAQE